MSSPSSPVKQVEDPSSKQHLTVPMHQIFFKRRRNGPRQRKWRRFLITLNLQTSRRRSLRFFGQPPPLPREKHYYLFGLTETFARDTIYSLQQSHFDFIRKYPSLKEILIETDPAVRMRGAISILIRYWCMEFMLLEYFLKEIGLCALGIDISLDNAAVTPLNSEMLVNLPEKRATGPTTSARESKRRRQKAMMLKEFSPIKQLVNVRSIQCLAQDSGDN